MRGLSKLRRQRPPQPVAPVVEPDPPDAEEEPPAPTFHPSKVKDRVLGNVVLRRRWSLHRHVHLVDAFERARALGEVSSVLSAGCGAGLSEIYLAAANPDVRFTLTDVDPARLDKAREVSDAWGVDNVTYGSLDLLTPRTLPRFDLVASIEVLEHIEDDTLAARNLLDHAERFAFILVPYCNEHEWADEARRARVKEQNDHCRPGYTHDTFAAILEGTDPVYVRNAYFMPQAIELREKLATMSNDEVVDQRTALLAEAALDIQDRVVAGGVKEASAIEALVDVGAR